MWKRSLTGKIVKMFDTAMVGLVKVILK